MDDGGADITFRRIVRPVHPPAGYIGGKRQLAARLVDRIEATPHGLYAEVFVGMGGVFLRRRSAPRVEAINDVSRDIAGFFRVLQRHYQPFMDMLKWQVASRAEFERLGRQPPETLTDLERAARFLYLQRLAFGGKVSGRTFGIDTHGPARFDVGRLGIILEALHERLAGVWIECLDWRQFLTRWDRPKTLFYLDPPYLGSESDYGKDVFGREQFPLLAERLKGLQGRFIMTLNDVPEVRDLFVWAVLEPVELTYSIASSNGHRARELLISSPPRAE